MSRPKGGKNREWSKEAKYAIIIQIYSININLNPLYKNHNCQNNSLT